MFKKILMLFMIICSISGICLKSKLMEDKIIDNSQNIQTNIELSEEETNYTNIENNEDLYKIPKEDNSNNVDVKNNDKTDAEIIKKEEPSKKEIIKKEVPSKTQDNVIEKNEKKQEIKQETKVEQPKVIKEEKVWDSLGISEYDYYHKPMWTWARIDYKSHEECINAGESLGYEIISFNCININSYSGNYLGDMLNVKYPE